MRARSLSLLDLGEQVVDITPGIVMLRCRADDFELFADAADRLASNPLGPMGLRFLMSARNARILPVGGDFQ